MKKTLESRYKLRSRLNYLLAKKLEIPKQPMFTSCPPRDADGTGSNPVLTTKKLKIINMDDIILNTNNKLTINTKPIVQIKNTISIVGSDNELPVEITADFTTIPPHLHEIYLSVLESKYHRNIRIWANTDTKTPVVKTIGKKKSKWRLHRILDLIFNTTN